MTSTFVNNLRLEEMATGEQSGSWGTKTNTNLELIGEALGMGTENLASDANTTITMADATSDGVRAIYLKITSSGSLSATRTVTLAPNTVSKLWVIENATTGSQSIEISQGSGANVTIENGKNKAVVTDGGGSGAIVYDAFADLSLDSVDINGGTITGITDLAIADGGTGAGSASAARTALGLAIGSDIAAFNADTLFADAYDNLTVGFSTDLEDMGSSGTGTETVDLQLESLKTLTITGSSTFAPDASRNGIAVVLTTNDGTGGYTLTTSGWDHVIGTYDNSANKKHLFTCYSFGATDILRIEALS